MIKKQPSAGSYILWLLSLRSLPRSTACDNISYRDAMNCHASHIMTSQQNQGPRPFRLWIQQWLILFSICCLVETTLAVQKDLPRFVIIKSNQVNARTGPGIDYPIEWVFIKKSEPVKVVAEYEQWRKIVDADGEGGWVHSSVLSPKRSVVITHSELVNLYNYPRLDAKKIALLESGLRCQFDRCKDSWCQIRCDNNKGWVESKYLWGLYKAEADDGS